MNGGQISRTATVNVSTQWLFLPPFVAIFTIAAVSLFATDITVPVNEALWGLTGLLFILCSILYGLFIHQDFFKGLLPTQAIAQGLLMCPLALRWGAIMWQWVGVTLAICGAVSLMVVYYRSRSALLERVYVTAPSDFDNLPVPCAVTDAQGNLLSVSDQLLQLKHVTRQEVEGRKVTLLLPLDREQINIDGKDWKIFQSPMSDDLYYFQLKETAAAQPALVAKVSFIDPATSLYTRTYTEKRVEEEFYRIRRYQRWMSIAQLRMDFHGANAPEKEEEIFNAYCRFVRSNVREIDTCCRIGPRDVFIMLPETQLSGAEMVVSKLADFVPSLQTELVNFEGAAEVREGVLFLDSSSDNLTFDQIVQQLDEQMESGGVGA